MYKIRFFIDHRFISNIMSYLRTKTKGMTIYPVIPTRQSFSHHSKHTRLPTINNNAIESIPVLQPPTFPRLSNYNEEEQYEQVYHYPTAFINDQHRTISYELPKRSPTIQLREHYKKRRLTRLPTQYIPSKSTSYLYYNH